MSFSRHREIFRSDESLGFREQRRRRSPVHRLDEFPVRYSSLSCTPAALTSASRTVTHSVTATRRWSRTFQPTANSVLAVCDTLGDKLILLPSGQSLGDNSNIIRYADPNQLYPNGSFRYYNQFGQPLNPATGNPGSNADTHIRSDYVGPLEGFPELE